MAKVSVEVFCAGCGKHVGRKEVDAPYYGPPEVKGCCPVCFPQPAPVKVEATAPAPKPAKTAPKPPSAPKPVAPPVIASVPVPFPEEAKEEEQTHEKGAE